MQGRGTPASPRQNSGNPQGSTTRQGKTKDTSPVFSGFFFFCSVSKEGEEALGRVRRENGKARELLAQPWPHGEAAKAEPGRGGSPQHASQPGHRSTTLAPGAQLAFGEPNQYQTQSGKPHLHQEAQRRRL